MVKTTLRQPDCYKHTLKLTALARASPEACCDNNSNTNFCKCLDMGVHRRIDKVLHLDRATGLDAVEICCGLEDVGF
jgi:hypothetical protein